ncbi:putative dehydrogenase/aryl-alcohol dehydrogenase-like putative oxidoreductase [Pararhizobium capsulatum DSM 1112]|uniref:Dehydrogenase/aryl-alcohol dehydrogenase-like putative oxidoreductase n=1 Tax=Pararhizobium capsulatum DSM 1112 TaxID=1121113 RepID=A0ABU0BUM2_9HYPH|nr:aldo/keto reductase [Pararhizobium capsulatum]MDQ0321957.1 putative dehydrogenase/aryl-alcohol dehydrogenase-like putative oxidoreductase [Pararhizobium capsulatum DSM 1112]
MTTTGKIRWGILGPGTIAKDFFAGATQSDNGLVVAIGTRNPKKTGLAESFPGTRIIGGYEALLADPEIDAVYIAVPHPGHAEWAIKAAEAGKHVLCEKPMGLSAAEVEAMQEAARKAGTFLGEAYMYRLHPLTAKLVELLKAKTIGEVRMIKSSFGFAKLPFDPDHRLFSNTLAGGGILDVGGYPVSMARLIAGIDEPSGYLDPAEVVAVGHLGETGVDEWTSALLHFPNGIIAEVSCSVSLAQDNGLRIIGTEGRIEIDRFWFAGGKRGGKSTIRVFARDGSRHDVDVDEPRHLYSFEVDAASEAIRAGRIEFSYPGMSRADTIGNLHVLDKWRAAIGLEYEGEKHTSRTRTLKGELLARKSDKVARGRISGLPKEMSLAALGLMEFSTFSGAAIVLDAFFEAGGNLVDTAFHYGGGMQDRLVGEWMQSRGVRAETVVIGKGAHSPLCYPEVIEKQLTVSLDRLKTDYVDIYFMHRDNPDIPVGEFVDAMDAEVRAGRIRGPFGGSNWTRQRMDEAIAYAERTGKTRPSVLSNNFSLAEMVQPVWAGCISSSDESWMNWLAAQQVTNFAWSSQARGFFTDRAGRGKLDDPELARAWYSEGNFARRDRAIELGKRIGKDPIQVALAYVLAQQGRVVPLIGPRSLAELNHSIEAFDIKLSTQDVRWLETGDK